MKNTDLDNVADIWLKTNISAHNYIKESYWKNNYAEVKKLLAQAEIYIYEDQIILGFIGLMDNYIAGIFVSEESQSKGIGKKLLDYAKGIKKELRLSVYEKNTLAISFYKREGFTIESENIDKDTNEQELNMLWAKK